MMNGSKPSDAASTDRMAGAWRESGKWWLLAGLALLVAVAAVSHQSIKHLMEVAEREKQSHLEDQEYRLLDARLVADRALSLLPIGTILGLGLLVTGMLRLNRVQKATEAELRLTTDRFEHALKNFPIVVFNQDLELRYTWIYKPALGYGVEEIIGKRDADIFERAEDAARNEAIKRDVIRSGRSRREEVLVHSKGVDRYYDLLVEPLLDNAVAIGVSCVAVDITARKEAEAALEESRNVLALALEAAKFGISDWDLVTDTMVWSDLRKEMSGLPPETEMSYEVSIGTVHPDDRAQLEAAKTRLLETKADGREEFRTLWPDGTVRWLHARGRIVEDATGTPVRYIGITLDITARKQAEEALQQSENFIRSVLNSLPAHVAVLDESGAVMTVNEPWERFSAENGGAAGWVATQANYLDICRQAAAEGDLYAQEAVVGLERVIQEKAEGYVMEYPCHAPDRERWFLMHIQRLFRRSGGVIVSHLDITARKIAEKALRESESGERARREELEALMDAIPVAIFITRDAGCRQMTANRAAEEMLRLPHHGNPSQSATEAPRPDFQAWSDGRRLAPEDLPMQRAAAMGVPVSGDELEIVFPDGEKRNLLGSAFPLFDDAGQVRGCIGAFVDITIRKRRELHTAFLAETLKSLDSVSSPAEILQLQGRQIAERLQLDHCVFVEINEADDQATVLHDHHAPDVPGLAGDYRLRDFHPEERLREMAAGKTVVIDDVRRSSRPPMAAEHYEGLGIGSLMIANHVVAGRWKFMLAALRRGPGEWLEEDRELLDELAERIYLRIERARADERLFESEARFRSIFNDAAVPMDVALPDGRFAQVNRAFCELLGYSEEELLATSFDAITHPDDRTALALDPLRNLIDGSIAGFRSEKRYIHKNGESVWVDLSVSVVRGADGNPAYFIGQIQNITARKQAEESLRKSENMLALAIEAGQLGIWNWDQATRTLVWSERCNEMTGQPRGSEVTYLAAMGMIHPDERARVHAEATRALEDKVDMELEYRSVWPDGTERWLQARGRAFYDEAGEVVRITGIMQDVTDRRESEEALRSFNSELESLVDKRTEDIRIAMQVLRHEFSERRRLEEEILNIGERAQARIGQDLHDDLGQQLVGMSILMQLLSSQLGAESHPRAPEAARLEAFLSDTINTTRSLAKSLYPVELERGGLILSLQDLANRTEMMAGITCTVTADKDFQFEKSAEIHLYRIVQESISNALKHGNARHIEIACTARDGISTLTVTDDGSGFIHPDSEQGVGIGLHLFQYRARLIGARITVARGENGGCQVTCSLGNPS